MRQPFGDVVLLQSCAERRTGVRHPSNLNAPAVGAPHEPGRPRRRPPSDARAPVTFPLGLRQVPLGDPDGRADPRGLDAQLGRRLSSTLLERPAARSRSRPRSGARTVARAAPGGLRRRITFQILTSGGRSQPVRPTLDGPLSSQGCHATAVIALRGRAARPGSEPGAPVFRGRVPALPPLPPPLDDPPAGGWEP